MQTAWKIYRSFLCETIFYKNRQEGMLFFTFPVLFILVICTVSITALHFGNFLMSLLLVGTYNVVSM